MGKKRGDSDRARFVAALLPETERILDDKIYYGPMLRGLSEALMEKGVMMRPLQCMQEYQKEQLLHSPPGFYLGVVFLGLLYKSRLFIEAVVRSFQGPKVILDHHFEDLAMHSVREDAVSGMRLVTEHVLSLGHERVAYLDMSDPEANPWKREGVDAALRAAGLPGLERGLVAGCRENFTDCSAALEWFLSLDPRPTAIICSDDARALYLLQAAAERGMRVPHDLSITGFGDFAVQSGRSEVLTSARVDTALMGRRGAELVLAGARQEPKSVLVLPELVVRGTTAAPGG
ncbi:MAG: LacI family DNA-binding transcriptional regulator [Planctomycetota bacterium]|jgi:DNA-binding LacI/PurR family transcriptional regulator